MLVCSFGAFFHFSYLDQMKIWSGTCGWIHPVFICGFVCTQLSQQDNWQSRRQDGDLFNEAGGERDTEGPDYEQTKHLCIFWAEMW